MEKREPRHGTRVESAKPGNELHHHSNGFDQYGEYESFVDGDREFLLYKNGKFGIKNIFGQEVIFPDLSTKEGIAMWEKAHLLKNQDDEIHKRRERWAHEHAEGDKILEQILLYAIYCSDGHEPNTITIDGVAIYEVGGNATHERYLGTKEGRLYSYTTGVGDIYLFPFNGFSYNGEGNFNEDTNQAIERMIVELYAYLQTSEMYTGTDSEGADLDDYYSLEECNKRWELFLAKNRNIITDALKPFIEDYKANRHLAKKGITITLDNKISIPIKVRPELVDVTDELKEGINIGRGAVFTLPDEVNTAPRPSVKTALPTKIDES